MTAIWPASLPQYVLSGDYGEAPRMAAVSFDSDTGPAIDRPKGTVKLTDIACSVVMTDEQLGTFEDFVHTDLGQATQPFYARHPRKGEQAKVKLVGRPPYQIAEVVPGSWRVSFKLLVIG